MDKKMMENFKKLKKQEKEMMDKYGWVVHFVFPSSEEDFFANYHTHGLKENFNHLDLQFVLPMERSLIHSLFHDIVDNIKDGVNYQEGKRYNNIIQRFDVKFKKFKDGERQVLRLLLPDENGKLPDEKGCNPTYASQLEDIDFDERVIH